MAKVLTLGRKSFLMKLYSAFQKKVIYTTSFHYTPYKVYSQFIWGDSGCYCTPVSSAKTNKFRAYKIVFGGKFFVDNLGLPKSVDIQQSFSATKKLLYGAYYHEIAHVKYTNMSDTRIRDYKDASLAQPLHQLMNILEDICIERCGMMKQHPYTKDYLLFLQTTVFEPEFCLDQYKNYFGSVDEDKSGEAFCSHLLYWLRCGQAYQGTNKFFTSHQVDIVDYVKKFMMTTNSKDRITICIQFFEWLLSQGLEFTSSQSPKNMPNNPLNVDGIAPSTEDTEGGTGGIRSSGHCDNDGSEEDRSFQDDDSSGNESKFDKNGPLGDASSLTAADLESFQSGSADVPVEYYSARKWYSYKDAVVDEVEKLLQQTSPLIASIANKINILKAKAKPKMVGGYRSGRLNINRAIQSEIKCKTDHYLFDRKKKSSICTDVAISFLVDCSGSMNGSKSLIASSALIAMVKACEKTATPCEINLFSTNWSDSAATLVNIKEYKDSLRTSKPYLGLACSDLEGSYACQVPDEYDYRDGARLLWNCNYDECCVAFVATALESRQEAYKVLVVLSDGGTCGSQDDLIKAVKNISDSSNIGLVGIGIGTDLPSKIYPDCKIFRDIKELEGLPVFLGEKLLKIMKGERS
jgi:hypothetical protein